MDDKHILSFNKSLNFKSSFPFFFLPVVFCEISFKNIFKQF